MKTPNNNKKIINRLAISYLVANRKKYYLAIIGIMLTCVMFTGISTAVLSMMDAVEQQMVATVGGDFHGSIKEVDFESAEVLQEHKSINNSYLSININLFMENEFERLPTQFMYIPFDSQYYTNINGFKGKPAIEYNEVVVSPNVLKLLNKPVDIGEVITLNYTILGESFTEDFVVTGITEDNPVIDVGFIYVSEVFMNENIKYNKNLAEYLNVEYLRSEENTDYLGMELYVNFNNKFNIMDKIETVISDSGYIPLNDENYSNNKDLRNNPNYFRYNANPIYTSNMNMDVLAVIAILISCLLVTISGYLIINNIFTISILRDINYYGQLKTVGATTKQIKKIIIRQGLYLSIIGIPIGLIVGVFVGNIMTTAMASGADGLLYEPKAIKVDYRVYFLSVIFVLLTVYISVLKPAKIVAKLSPMESLKYTNKKKSIKVSNKINHDKKVTPLTFAIRNLKSQKSTTLKVIIGIALCPIILNGVYSFANGYLNEEEYINAMAPSSFIIGSNQYFNYRFYNGSAELSEESVDFVKDLDMFTEENQGEIYTYLNNGGKAVVDTVDETVNLEHFSIYGMEQFPLSKYDVILGEIDYEKFLSGDYIIYIGSFDENKEYPPKEKYEYINHFYPGDKVSLTINGVEKEYEIMAVVDSNYYLGLRYGPMEEFILPLEELRSLGDNVYRMSYIFDVDDKDLYEVEEIMSEYKETNNEGTRYSSKVAAMENARGAKSSVLIPGIILTVIIGIISIMNFINIILASIISREKEFAIMQSIGMTRDMKKKIIMYEGLIYALCASIIFVILGAIVDLILIQSMTSGVAFPNYEFDLTLLLICVPVCFIVITSITLIIFRLNDSSSVIEKLRLQ